MDVVGFESVAGHFRVSRAETQSPVVRHRNQAVLEDDLGVEMHFFRVPELPLFAFRLLAQESSALVAGDPAAFHAQLVFEGAFSGESVQFFEALGYFS